MRYPVACSVLLLFLGTGSAAAQELPNDAVTLGCYLESNGVRTPVTLVFSQKLQALRWQAAWWDAAISPDSIDFRPTSESAQIRFEKSFRMTIDRRTGRLHLRSADGGSTWGACKVPIPSPSQVL
jgi:hypothetical protein